jgi:hypothetical protein
VSRIPKVSAVGVRENESCGSIEEYKEYNGVKQIARMGMENGLVICELGR